MIRMRKDVNYHYRFIRTGTTVDPEMVDQNVVWIDVGNHYAENLFDHHQGIEGINSSAGAICKHPEYLSAAAKAAKSGEEITFVIHTNPDLDSIASCFLAQFYIENGEEGFRDFLEQKRGSELVSFVDSIDLGKGKITDYPTLYSILCVLGDDYQDDAGQRGGVHRFVMMNGLEILNRCVDAAMTDAGFSYAGSDISSLIEDKYSAEINAVKKDYETYLAERDLCVNSFGKVYLWTKDGHQEAVRAAIWTDLTKSSNGYNVARKEGCFLTVVPRKIKGKEGSEVTRVLISVNPDIEGYERFTLKPVAEILEQMEQAEEAVEYEKGGQLRRDYSKPRSEAGLFSTKPFSVTADPWFISPAEDVVNAPGAGSILEYSNIIDVIQHNAGRVKRAYSLAITRDETQRHTAASVCIRSQYDNVYSITEWLQKSKDQFNSDPESYMVFIAELDASIICRNNRLLDSYCLSLVGRSLIDRQDACFYHPDYRTSIYCDGRCTVILLATDESGYEKTDLSRILPLSSGNELTESVLINDIAKSVSAKWELEDISNRMEKSLGKRKEIETLNNMIIRLSAKLIEQDANKDDYESRIHHFIQERIELLKMNEMVKSDVHILVAESRDRTLFKFNLLSSIAVPFLLISTLFQVSFFTFEEMLFLKGDQAKAAWGITGLAVLIITIIIYRWGNGRRKDT